MSENLNLDFDTVITKYVELRAKCEEIDRDAKRRIAEIKKSMGLLEAWVTERADEEGLKTVPAKAGTAYWSTHYTCSAAEPAVFFDYVKSHEAWELLEKRASKTAVKAFIDEQGSPPPGINFSAYRAFNVRENKE